MLAPLLAVSLVVSAFEPQGPSPYKVDYVFDSTLTLGSFASLLVFHEIMGKSLDNDYVCSQRLGDQPCDPKGLSKFDRGTIGKHSKAWDHIGTYGLFVIAGGAILGSALDNALSDSDQRFRGFAADALVIVEATGLSTFFTHAIRYGIRRPRPTQYAGAVDVDMSAQERHLSFPSGHATSTTAITTAFATTFWLRHPDSPWRWVVAGGGVVAAGLSNYGRVGAGRHFPSDILAGSIIGTAFGILVPLAHRADVSVGVTTGEQKSVTVGGAF
jgi:membrane-associated phospholipid phosphatase